MIFEYNFLKMNQLFVYTQKKTCISNLYFCSSSSKLGLNPLLAPFVIIIPQTEKAVLFDMAKFIQTKDLSSAIIVHMQLNSNNI